MGEGGGKQIQFHVKINVCKSCDYWLKTSALIVLKFTTSILSDFPCNDSNEKKCQKRRVAKTFAYTIFSDLPGDKVLID